MEQIKVENLTKDYGNNKGVFQLNLEIKEGEIFGLLGANGAGKTTIIRHIMGFLNADEGTLLVDGKHAFKEASFIQETVGYLPGEVALMEDMTGAEFLKFMAEFRGIKDKTKMEELIQYFELDVHTKIRKMSKGMKQKVAIICAFMHSPKLLILDEPTSGLDPLMQKKFMELIQSEKQKGSTILLSTHIFDEVERCCDRVAFIKNGKIMSVQEIKEIMINKKRVLEITFEKEDEKKVFQKKFGQGQEEGNKIFVQILGNVDATIKELANYNIVDIGVHSLSLEEIFLHYYGEEKGEK